jgi:hypothetical protein
MNRLAQHRQRDLRHFDNANGLFALQAKAASSKEAHVIDATNALPYVEEDAALISDFYPQRDDGEEAPTRSIAAGSDEPVQDHARDPHREEGRDRESCRHRLRQHAARTLTTGRREQR